MLPQAYIDQNKDRILAELFELLRIPSISTQTEHKADITKVCDWLLDHMSKLGMDTAELLPTSGNPIVFAQKLVDPALPTILIYGHYDVQAPDPIELWQSKPFEPELRNGNIYGRGTADDKGQLFTHLKAVEYLLASRTCPVNVKFVFEGEEEIGSKHFAEGLTSNSQRLAADICIISDTHAFSPSSPAITYGLKGLVYSQVTLEVMPIDAHSGVYGGNIPNAVLELCWLLAQLKDSQTQKVLIDGFYQNVRVLSDKERAQLSKASLTEQAVLSETSVQKVIGESEFTPAERAGARPTLDVNGIWGGYIQEGEKTIIPAKASAKVSMRTVPNQTGEEIAQKFLAYINKIKKPYYNVHVEILSKTNPVLVDTSSDYFKNAEQAMIKTFGAMPEYELSGGSIRAVEVIKNVLGIDSILMGFGLPDDNLHAPNEKLSLEMFFKGIQTSIEFMTSFKSN